MSVHAANYSSHLPTVNPGPQPTARQRGTDPKTSSLH